MPDAATTGSTPSDSPPLLRVRDLHVHFPPRFRDAPRSPEVVRAVDGVSFDIQTSSTLGLVGESGCGKTTLGRALLRLVPITGGTISFDGIDIGSASNRALLAVRRSIGIVFQDPYSSLNPRLTIEAIVGEPLAVHGISRRQRGQRVAEVLSRVGVDPACGTRYPHELSGGQRQRIDIARAIVMAPRFVICDECTSSLDVSVQARILNLLGDLQRDLGLTYLFISHDLAVVSHAARRIAVMYLGRIVELGDRADIFESPAHPYTHELLASVPTLRPRAFDEPPPPDSASETPGTAAPGGCPFHPRCSRADDVCRETAPRLMSVSDERRFHRVACHHPGGPPGGG